MVEFPQQIVGFLLLVVIFAIDFVFGPQRMRATFFEASARLLFLVWFCALFVAIVGRPVSGLIMALVVITAIHITSYVKFRLLQEPLVFSDLALVGNALKYPELYYIDTYFKLRWAVPGALLCLAVVWVIGLEQALWGNPLISIGLVGVWIAAAIASIKFASIGPLKKALSRAVPNPDLERDLARFGLLLTLSLYFLRWRSDRTIHRQQPVSVNSAPSLLTNAAGDTSSSRIDTVVIVQCESFLDPFRAGLTDRPLEGLEALRKLSFAHGCLNVPAVGAYTMRSEAAVLTGLSQEQLGFESFDPYLSIASPRVPSLAYDLRSRGWRTTFVHPFDLRFFNRDKILPRLGFDTLVDISAFNDGDRRGPYIADKAVADCIANLCAEPIEGAGTLVHAVTMENHGPWPDGRLPGTRTAREAWLEHVRGTDEALTVLLNALSARSTPTVLAIYGDHVPILPGTDKGLVGAQTDYAIAVLNKNSSISDHSDAKELQIHEIHHLIRNYIKC